MVPMACQCRPKFRHWLPLVTVGTIGMPMFTNGYQWFLPLAANHADNLEGRPNYQRAKWRHPQLNKFHIYCILLIFTGSRVKITLKITYIANILWKGYRGSICFCNKAVANGDLLSLFTTSRKVANDSQYPFGVFRLTMIPMATNDSQWYHW